MKQRIVTALILAIVAVCLILLAPTSLFASVLVVVWAVAVWEWTGLIGMRAAQVRIAAVLAVVLAQAGLWSVRDGSLWWVVLAAGVIWWPLALLWMRRYTFSASPTSRNKAIKLLAGLCVLVPAWAALVQLHGETPDGRLWTLFALVLVWAADTFAYFAGSRFGRNKLAPRISPGKTLEGVWGALIGTALVALIAGWWMQQRGAGLALLVGLAVLCVVFSIIGDLFESLMKRQAGVKDSGSLFPGHGGMLDRLDGVFAALPLFVIGKVGIDLLVAP